LTEKGWLESKLEEECANEVDDIDAIIAAETPRVGALEAAKAALFDTWWQLEAEAGETEAAFRARMEGVFGTMYGDTIAPVDSGVTFNTVPESCAQATQDKYAEV
jgi:hypothetical protein